jgi:AraC-like DNA-binding protein
MTAGDKAVTARATQMFPETAPANKLRGLFGPLERLGFDIDAMLAEFGFRRADAEDPDGVIPAHVCAGVLARAREERRYTNLALRLAENTPLGVTPLLDYLIASSDTVGDAYHQLAKHLRLVNPSIHIEVCEESDPILIKVSCAIPFVAEYTVSLSVLHPLREADGLFHVEQICFRHQPEDPQDVSTVLGCEVQVHAEWDGLAISRDCWRIPLRRRDPVLRRWLERKAATILARQPLTEGMAAQVRQMLATPTAGGDMSIQAVARRLAIAPRTLQRRLSQEGTSFDAERESARKEAASAFLTDPTLSIAEIAFLLGYSEPAAFHRAFKRWHGTTPQAFRQQGPTPE